MDSYAATNWTLSHSGELLHIEEFLIGVAEDVGAHPEEGGYRVHFVGLVNDRKVTANFSTLPNYALGQVLPNISFVWDAIYD